MCALQIIRGGSHLYINHKIYLWICAHSLSDSIKLTLKHLFFCILLNIPFICNHLWPLLANAAMSMSASSLFQFHESWLRNRIVSSHLCEKNPVVIGSWMWPFAWWTVHQPAPHRMREQLFILKSVLSSKAILLTCLWFWLARISCT